MLNLNYWFIWIIKFFWILLQEFFLLKLLIFLRRQKTILSTPELLQLIASLNLDHAVVNSAWIPKLNWYYSTLTSYLLNKANGNFLLFLKFFFIKLFNRNDLWAKIVNRNFIKSLDLSLNSYIGIIFIIIGLIVRVDLKFSMQKDL